VNHELYSSNHQSGLRRQPANRGTSVRPVHTKRPTNESSKTQITQYSYCSNSSLIVQCLTWFLTINCKYHTHSTTNFY